MIDNKTIGERLKQVRSLINVNASAFAKKADIDISQYTKAEKGLKGLGSQKLLALCSKWGLNMDYLLTGKGHPLDGSNATPAVTDATPDITRDPIAILTRWREDIEAKYQDSNRRELALIEALKSIGSNLSQGQMELKEQIAVTGDHLAQLLTGMRSDFAGTYVKTGKGGGARKANIDGKGKGR